QTGLSCHVGEGAVAIVVEEVARGLAAGTRGIEARAVHQEDVHPAVVIVIDERDARAHLFEQVLLVICRTRHIARVGEASSGGNVGEFGGEGGGGQQRKERAPPHFSFRNSRRFCSSSLDSRSSLVNSSIAFRPSSALPSLR